MKVNIKFLGAAKCVTASLYLVETEKSKILIDCGLYQGDDAALFTNDFDFEPCLIDALILTHSHLDHSGRIPLLVKKGFIGPIYSTKATAELSDVMLLDSANIQENDAEWQNRKNIRIGKKIIEPLYTKEDANNAINLFSPLSYDEIVQITEDISIRLVDAGHLLGSASIEIFTCKNKIVFSGDIGNFDQPIIKDPKYIKEADYVIMESTYGDRSHSSDKELRDLNLRIKHFKQIIKNTMDKKGKLIIPSFAIGRTQELLYMLRSLNNFLNENSINVYLDSPLAIKATQIFSSSLRGDYFDDEAEALIQKGINPIEFSSLIKIVKTEDSIALNKINNPCIIISSSGMAEGGRIKHHLKHNLYKKENTILFVGYQARGTLGRQILDGKKKVRIFNEIIDVKADVLSLPGLSGHADKEGLIKWLKSFKIKPKCVFLTHGDENTINKFKSSLEDYNVIIPSLGDNFDLENLKIITKAENIANIKESLINLEKEKNKLNDLIIQLQHSILTYDPKDNKIASLLYLIDELAEEIKEVNNKFL